MFRAILTGLLTIVIGVATPAAHAAGTTHAVIVGIGTHSDAQIKPRVHAVQDAQAVYDLLDALDRYFAGDLTAIDALAVNPSGTPFQLRVWSALRDVRAGSTTSYSAVAKRLGTPQAVRAVGAANGANPIPIVIPCHRVIGADGRLVGYGGGLERKRWLLAHEGVRSGLLL